MSLKTVCDTKYALEVCNFSLSFMTKINKEVLYAFFNKEFCISQIYSWGYRFHSICIIIGVFQSFDFSQASVYSIHYLIGYKIQILD